MSLPAKRIKVIIKRHLAYVGISSSMKKVDEFVDAFSKAIAEILEENDKLREEGPK